ncbi:swi5-dependent recombination DNA repair protein 1 homolog [Leptopilina boulardi]|uniref:swi5-dependent recombination DNA repair protein 1 homolog n=1 Tax=Leptopilina boulardi TaxID=63433 RepID=UPI0021F548BB|nr:swi5-dependent recombination DNA repair protein 1 homolog [Leptopilina boulardi]
MRTFLISSILVVLVAAEPPAYRQRYYVAQQREEVTQDPSLAPYAPSGWKPNGPAFNLPQRQVQPSLNEYGSPSAPQNQYGPPSAPQNQYGPAAAAPPNQYGPPSAPQNQYGPSAAPSNQYGPPSAPQNQYGPSAAPSNQYGPPSAPENQYGPSAAPSQNQYGPPSVSQNQYGSPAAPQKQYRYPAAPQTQYGPAAAAPQQQYGSPVVPLNPYTSQQFEASQKFRAAQKQTNVPQSKYGPPEYTTTEYPNTTEFDEPTTVKGLTESESEPVNSVNELGEETGEIDEQQKKSGQYFVALPDGRLQRVRYVSREDVEAMKYFAKIRADNVEPLRGPIYSYAPLQKLQITPGSSQLGVSVSAPVPVEVSRPERLLAPKVDIQPLAQVQYQLDSPGNVIPLSSSFSTYTANYQVPAPSEQKFIISV